MIKNGKKMEIKDLLLSQQRKNRFRLKWVAVLLLLCIPGLLKNFEMGRSYSIIVIINLIVGLVFAMYFLTNMFKLSMCIFKEGFIYFILRENEFLHKRTVQPRKSS